MKAESIVIVKIPSHSLLKGQVVPVHKLLDDGRIQVLACGVITTVRPGDVEPFTIED